MQSDTRELEMRARTLERTLAERRARSQQASASQSFPAMDDGRQSSYGRDADRGARGLQQQQQQQQQQQFAGVLPTVSQIQLQPQMGHHNDCATAFMDGGLVRRCCRVSSLGHRWLGSQQRS